MHAADAMMIDCTTAMNDIYTSRQHRQYKYKYVTLRFAIGHSRRMQRLQHTIEYRLLWCQN